MSFADRVRETFARDAARASIEYRGRTFRWGDVAAAADALDRLLESAGVAPGLAVGVVAHNRAAQLGTAYALMSRGRCATLISPALTPERLAAEIRSLRLPMVAAAEELIAEPAVRAALAETGAAAIALRSDFVGAAQLTEGFSRVAAGREYRARPEGGVEISTSGTTGDPKRISHPSVTLEKAALSEVGVMANIEARVEPERRNAPFLMPYPISTAACFHTFHPAMTGRAIALMDKFDIDEWLDAMRRHRPPCAYSPPAGMRMLLEAKPPREIFAGTLAVRTGGAPLESEAIARLHAEYGLRITPQYGATEYCGVVTWWPMEDLERHAESKRSSVGRARPDVELRVISTETGKPLPAGETGILEVRVGRVGPEWMRSTDLATIDADGFLFIRGRADDAINRGGFKILPEPLADVLRLHPSVRDASVVGMPDPRLGEVPVAAVELREGVSAPSEDELLAHVRRHVPSYQVPTRIRVVAALPRNAMQKVVRAQVREMF